MSDNNTLFMAVIKNPISVFTSTVIPVVLEEILYPLEEGIVVYILFSKNLLVFLLAILLTPLILLPAYAYAFLVSPLIIIFKGEESELITRYLGLINSFLVPMYFSYLAFSYYNIVKYIPPIGLIEELRRLLFLGRMDLVTFTINVLESIVLFIVGVYAFQLFFNKARKEGWIGLK